MFFEEILENDALWIALLAWFIAQLIKLIICFIRFKKINLRLMISSGGMPSSHSAFVTAITTAIGINEGFDTPLFALGAIISLVVMYDASGIRRAAGKQAEILNLFLDSVENGFKLDKKLKEELGHTPVQVLIGALLGILVAITFNHFV